MKREKLDYFHKGKNTNIDTQVTDLILIHGLSPNEKRKDMNG